MPATRTAPPITHVHPGAWGRDGDIRRCADTMTQVPIQPACHAQPGMAPVRFKVDAWHTTVRWRGTEASPQPALSQTGLRPKVLQAAPRISRASHARAIAQSRFTVAAETPMMAAVSSTDSPAK
jgi:hypothetical protein